MIRMSHRVEPFGTTIFSEINSLARQYNAVNLGQGAPDFDGPPEVLAAAVAALHNNANQYAPGLGYLAVRQAVADHSLRFYGQVVDPETEVAIMAGATEAMLAAILGLLDAGDEAILFQPAFDSYAPQMRMAGVTTRYVTLNAPDWTFDPAELDAAFNDKTRAIILNTPNNPTGKAFNRAELEVIAELCCRHDVIALTDEVYEHLLYDGIEHVRLATLPGMAERTLTISSLGKTFSVTGWKIGWVIGPAELVTGVIRAHQFNTFAVASPLQLAAATALALPDSYYAKLTADFQARRDLVQNVLQQVGFEVWQPHGGYFVLAKWRNVAPESINDDMAFVHWLIKGVGVACIPVSCFYQESDRAAHTDWVRFAVCKTDATLNAAVERLQKLSVTTRVP
jgi:N-succinyldiaminopimelate aminotransferase